MWMGWKMVGRGRRCMVLAVGREVLCNVMGEEEDGGLEVQMVSNIS